MTLSALPLALKHITIKFSAVYNAADMDECIRLFAQGQCTKARQFLFPIGPLINNSFQAHFGAMKKWSPRESLSMM